MTNRLLNRLESTKEQLTSWGTGRLEELQSRQKELLQRKGEILERGEKALDLGVGALRTAEATALETARALLVRAGENFGDKAPFLKRGEDALSDALIALRAGHQATLPIEDYNSLSVKKILPLLAPLDAAGLRTIQAYELGNKARKTLLREIDTALSPVIIAEA